MKVLIVDDSNTMRRIVINAFNGAGYGDSEFLEAGDGLEAIAQVESNPDVGLITLDWNMPNMNGLEFLKKIREDFPKEKLPIIMVTTEAEKTNVITAIKHGANNYLTKPFQPAQLGEKVKATLGG